MLARQRFLNLSLLVLLFSSELLSNDWEKIAEKEGVTSWKKDIPDSSLFAFKAKARINGSFSRLINAFLDVKHHRNWVDMYNGAELVKKLDGYSSNLYHRIILPSPIHMVVDERDFVLKMDISADPEKKEVKGQMRSIKLAARPNKDCCVRARVEYGRFLFKSLTAENAIEIEVEAHIDPKGVVPGWIVYYVQKHWAADTILGLKKVASDKSIAKHPDFVSWESEQ